MAEAPLAVLDTGTILCDVEVTGGKVEALEEDGALVALDDAPLPPPTTVESLFVGHVKLNNGVLLPVVTPKLGLAPLSFKMYQ